MRYFIVSHALATVLMFLVIAALGGCAHEPVLPPNLPMPKADLMVKPSATPLPTLPDNKPVTLTVLYPHAVQVRGQCVADRTRLDHLQQYVKGLTK